MSVMPEQLVGTVNRVDLHGASDGFVGLTWAGSSRVVLRGEGGRESPQMPLRERASRAGLEVLLERQGPSFVGKLDYDVNTPRSTARRVWGPTVVVIRKPSRNIRGHTGVVPIRIGFALEDVDEPLHASRVVQTENRPRTGRIQLGLDLSGLIATTGVVMAWLRHLRRACQP